MNHLTMNHYELSVRHSWPHERVLPVSLRGLPSSVWRAALGRHRRPA